MIFGYPSTERPAALNIEKFQAVQCSEIQTQLGIEINSRKLEITLPTQKFNQIHKLLTGTWHTSRRQFRPLEATQLLGFLRHAVAVSWWGKYTFMALQAALGMAIRNESLRQMRSQVAVGPLPKLSQYKHTWQQIVVTALRQPDMEWTSTRAGLRKAFKVDWHLMGKAAMTTDLHQELEFLRYLFSDNKCRHWKIPLAQVVPWVSHFTVYANASLSGLGAACKELQFFMQLHIPLCIQRRTLLHMSSAEARNNPLFVPINDLELAAAIFSYAAAKCAILSYPPSISSKRLVLQLFSDNVPALAHLEDRHSSVVRISLVTQSLLLFGERCYYYLSMSSKFLGPMLSATQPQFIKYLQQSYYNVRTVLYDIRCAHRNSQFAMLLYCDCHVVTSCHSLIMAK